MSGLLFSRKMKWIAFYSYSCECRFSYIHENLSYLNILLESQEKKRLSDKRKRSKQSALGGKGSASFELNGVTNNMAT
jgi:hypothetical protein